MQRARFPIRTVLMAVFLLVTGTVREGVWDAGKVWVRWG
jgi:hypothetical protein